MERLISLVGLFAMMGLAWLLGSRRRSIPVRVIAGGVVLQFVLALLILKTDAGRALFAWIGGLFLAVLESVRAGTAFVFGESFPDSNLAFRVLPSIIVFATLTSVLYHFGILQQVIRAMAWLMQRTLRTSGAESLCAAANIFVGLTEAPLVVRPYLASMTASELMAVMVGGFATIAGGVLAAYISFGIDAGHLVTASVISAPAALVIAKILQPEVETPRTLGTVRIEVKRQTVNFLHAVAAGASDGVKLTINVAAMLIAFLALIALVNGFVGWLHAGWSLELFLGYLFAPLAWLMGVEMGDCLRVGELLGIKMVANEFIAYERLASWMADGSDVRLSPRSITITTYALCGFANFGSVGVQLGGLGPLIPGREGDLARLAFRAMLGGALAGFMTACVAGILI